MFEYGEAYIQSETPYVDFLKIISRHLKPDGKIVLAIENRLGLKYWAGCTEDHFGTLFEGLEEMCIRDSNTPLHDGAVIVRGNRIVAATCYLPLSDNMELSKQLGTRHRAGVGISEVTDSVTIIVSEETGQVSVAQKMCIRDSPQTTDQRVCAEWYHGDRT